MSVRARPWNTNPADRVPDRRGEEGELNGGRSDREVSDRCPRCGGRLEPDWTACGWCGRHNGPVTPAELAETPAVELPAGTMLLGRYRIGALLGRGGFGLTYRARDTRLGRDVAVKELFPPGALRRGTQVTVTPDHAAAFGEALQRFQREATSLARFNHPGIVQIFEVFEANRTAYLVMELIRGPSVGQLLQRRGTPLEVDEVLDVVLRVGGALGAVHAAGLLHRDINPSNIMVDGARRIVLIDFGLARRFGDEISGSLTRAVTPGYAPPEQYAGSAESGPACDVFGLAATAYKLLTGVTPTNVFDRQAGGVLTAPHDLREGVPTLISAAILDGMELDPAHRPAGTDAFLNRLGLHGTVPGGQVLLGQDVSARPAAVTPDPLRAAPVAVAGVTVPPPPVGPLTPVTGGPGRPGVAVPPMRRSPVTPYRAVSPATPAVVRRRGLVTWPVGVAATALASASPLLVTALLAYVAVPALATFGDLEQTRGTGGSGMHRGRLARSGPWVFLPVRFVRNLAVGLARSIAAVAVAAIGIATVQVLVDAAVGSAIRDFAVRCTGIAMALVLLLPIRHAGRGFRTEVGIDAAVAHVMTGSSRVTSGVAVVWVVSVAVTAVAVWLRPELWPLS